MSNDLSHIENIRRSLPATTKYAYFNAGSFGPIPDCVYEAVQQRIQREWSDGRMGMEFFQSISATYQAARRSVARLLQAEEQEITLTDNTGEGMNIVCYGFNWQPGDEIITTNHEHIGALAPLYQIRNRYGAVVHFADLGPRADQPIIEAFAKLITPRTRLLVLSHVTWTTGAILDIQAVAQLAHAHNIPVLIDGAQSAGNIPVNVKELDVDFYAIPMQKWLCGPDGTGALYVRAQSLELIDSTYVGYYSNKHGAKDQWEMHATAQRFELGGRQTAAIAGQAAALQWLEENVGYDWLFSRIATLNRYAYDQLAAISGIIILTPEPGKSGILSFKIEGQDADEIVKQLYSQHNINIRSIQPDGILRISTGFYNTEEEVDRLVNILAQYIQ